MTQEVKDGLRDFAIVLIAGLVIVGLISIWNNLTESSWDRAERIYEQRYGDINRGVYLP